MPYDDYYQVCIEYYAGSAVGERRRMTHDVQLPYGSVIIRSYVTPTPRDVVQVRFLGNSTPYSYRIDPADNVQIGDRVAVWSPLTDRVEYPEVIGFERVRATKWARVLPR
jgi:hypothetical protein